MDADAVRAYIAARWPDAMQSPLAQAVQSFCVADEASRAVEFAQLQASATECELRAIRRDAMEHAFQCIDACEAEGIAYDEETLSFHIESSFDLDTDECDDIAAAAIRKWRAA